METDYFKSHRICSFGGTENGDWSVVGVQCKVGDKGPCNKYKISNNFWLPCWFWHILNITRMWLHCGIKSTFTNF